MRKNPLINNEIYHIFSRSIADFKIFNNNTDFVRMQKSIKYYQINNNNIKLSRFINSIFCEKNGFYKAFNLISKDKENTTQIVAYCLMPTHIHLILKQLKKNGISNYLNNMLNSYSRYFNTKHKRKGPLWESRFKSVLVDNDEQLIHLTRYIHLNPVTAKIINKPEDWKFSSYKEYINIENNQNICQFNDILEIKPNLYKKFVKDQISYQRDLAIINRLLVD